MDWIQKLEIWVGKIWGSPRGMILLVKESKAPEEDRKRDGGRINQGVEGGYEARQRMS